MSSSATTPENEVFWLERAGTYVTTVQTELKSGGTQLVTAMGWIWTFYSTAAFVVLTQADASTPTVTVVAIIAPVLLIFLAYLAATRVILPIPFTFDNRVPAEIKQAHDETVRRRLRRLRWSTGLAALAAVSVAVSVTMAAVSNISSGPASSDAAVFSLSADGEEILVGGQITGTDRVTVQIIDPAGMESEYAVPLDEGEYRESFDVTAPGDYSVTVRWSASAQEHTVTETLKKK